MENKMLEFWNPEFRLANKIKIKPLLCSYVFLNTFIVKNLKIYRNRENILMKSKPSQFQQSLALDNLISFSRNFRH